MLAPAYDLPGVWPSELSVAGNVLLAMSLTFFAPCNYQAFCESEQKIVDKYLLETRVPASENCDIQYCLTPASLVDPYISSFYPTQGPSTGGTIVSIKVSNLPAFRTSDLSVTVGSGASRQVVPAETVTQDPGSSTRNCKGAQFSSLSSPP